MKTSRNFISSILVLVALFASSSTQASNSCQKVFEVDNRFLSVSDQMRFLKEPASWEYLEATASHLSNDNYFWDLKQAGFKDVYDNYRKSNLRQLADVLKIPKDEVKSQPLLMSFFLHPLELRMIRRYTGDIYWEINQAIRSGNWKKYGLEIEILNSALSRLRRESEWTRQNASWLKDSSRETLVRRYIKIDTNKPGVLSDFLERYKVGSHVEEKSFLSTTLQNTTEHLYVTGNILFEITQSSGVYISSLASVSGKNGKLEAEVLLPPQSRFIVTEVNHVNGRNIDYVIKMKEELPTPGAIER